METEAELVLLFYAVSHKTPGLVPLVRFLAGYKHAPTHTFQFTHRRVFTPLGHTRTYIYSQFYNKKEPNINETK